MSPAKGAEAKFADAGRCGSNLASNSPRDGGSDYRRPLAARGLRGCPGITCHPLETEGPGPWLINRVPWTNAELKISAHEAPPEVASDLNLRARTACLVVDCRTWNGNMPVTHARMWHPGSRHSLVVRFGPSR
jgi:UTRA domain